MLFQLYKFYLESDHYGTQRINFRSTLKQIYKNVKLTKFIIIGGTDETNSTQYYTIPDINCCV